MDGLDPSTQSARIRARERFIAARTRGCWVGGSKAAHGELGVIPSQTKTVLAADQSKSWLISACCPGLEPESLQSGLQRLLKNPACPRAGRRCLLLCRLNVSSRHRPFL